MILFFQESNGDFLAIETESNLHYFLLYGKDHFEGRATAIEGLVGSVCTTAISREFLAVNCTKTTKRKVPAEWLKAIGY
jgi:hypothetical protein